MSPTPSPAQVTMYCASSFFTPSFTFSCKMDMSVPASNSFAKEFRKARPSAPAGQPFVFLDSSNLTDRTVESDGAARRAFFWPGVYKLSGVRRKRVPSTAPDAPNRRYSTTCAPLESPPATRIGGQFSGIAFCMADRRSLRGGPRAEPWPPASIPNTLEFHHPGLYAAVTDTIVYLGRQ